MFLNFLSVWISFNLIATNAYANVTNKDHRRYDKQDAEVILKVIKNLKEIIMVDNEDHPRGSKRTNEIIKIKNVILENADTDSYYVLVNGEKVNSSRIFIQNTDGLYIRLDTNATSLPPYEKSDLIEIPVDKQQAKTIVELPDDSSIRIFTSHPGINAVPIEANRNWFCVTKENKLEKINPIVRERPGEEIGGVSIETPKETFFCVNGLKLYKDSILQTWDFNKVFQEFRIRHKDIVNKKIESKKSQAIEFNGKQYFIIAKNIKVSPYGRYYSTIEYVKLQPDNFIEYSPGKYIRSEQFADADYYLSNGKNETLIGKFQSDEDGEAAYNFEIIWTGDLNGDHLPDFYVHKILETDKNGGDSEELLLSPGKSNGELFKSVAGIEYSIGC